MHAPTSSPTEIRIRRLVRTYHVGETAIHALRGVDLEVAAGDFLGIIGVSGSGKSTLLHLIGGLDSPTSGDVDVAGKSLGGMSRRQRSHFRRSTVGFVFQSFYLVPTLSAEANVRLALTFQGVYGAKRTNRSLAALDRVGLADRRDHRPGQLSVGQQQRVAVARATVHRPRVLLADEPTANLDQATAHQLMELLAQINRESKTTIVIVTHDDELAERYCGRVIRMFDGRLTGEGASA